MPKSNSALVTFTAGEWTSRLDARRDLDKAKAALRICKNMIINRDGGVYRRPGLKYVASVKVIP